MAEWAQLPKDLLEQISKCLETSIDILRFRSVCTSWRSAISPKPRRLSGTFRILPNDGISHTSFGFYLSRRTIFLIGLPNSHYQTDPDGWLVKIEEDNPDRKHLLNPLSRCKLNSLPSNFPRILNLLNFRVSELGQEYVLHHVNYKSNSSSSDIGNLYMEKVVIIWLNCETEFMLLTIHVSGKLAVFKSGDKKWTIIQDMPSPYDDVIVYKGNFYAVDNTGRTVVVGLNTELSLIANPVFGGDKKYLVESNGELLLVDMYLSIDTGEGSLSFDEEYLEHLAQYMSERTVRFKVFKLDEEVQSWIEVKSLGNRVLFLGDDSTFSATVSDLKECKGNCIFFVDNFFYPREDYPSGGDDGLLVGGDIGVFDLESGAIGPLGNYPEHAKMFWPPPHWVTLNLYGGASSKST
ncbi:hypothetical protein JCGZ_20944 [Jatropha curcas]|uniref:F-box domain-containing protein n=1 Tax=Jatropha curcas TaxID=180498 RepID=A0A067JTA2_JATCU|nr:F-box protein SKIP23 [Jatropha curcas]KDP27132.1 hypothetical protein JCGZ_20944 [Jatropha curcas]